MPELDRSVEQLRSALADLSDAEYRARQLTEQLALTMQASLLVQAGNRPVAEAFVRSRLGGYAARNYGTLPTGIDTDVLLSRADPSV